MIIMRLRRSLAFCKGLEPEKVQMLIDSNVDCVVMDLEDGVVSTRKPENRTITAEILKQWDFKGKERVLRINGPHTPFYQEDMEQVVRVGLPDAIRLPKCEFTEYILRVARDLKAIEHAAGLPENTIEIILMIETAKGIMNTYDMCCCSERVTAVGIGMEDLTASMGILRRYELGCLDLIYARQKMVLEAKAAHIQAIDSGVLFNAETEYIYRESVIARQMGFDGRSCSARYPHHIDFANKAFSPAPDEVLWANKVVAAYNEATAQGNSEVYVDGKFVDPPVVLKAQNVLDLMRQIDTKQ